MNWRRAVPFEGSGEGSTFRREAESALVRAALRENVRLERRAAEFPLGATEPDWPGEPDFRENGRVHRWDDEERVWTAEDGILWVCTPSGGALRVGALGTPDFVARFPWPDVAGRTGVHILTMDPDLDIKPVYGVAQPLVEDNYAPFVVEAFGHVAADLASSNPCGRLVLLHGLPGTGKTFLIRGLAAVVHGATFIVVPPATAQKIAEPGLIEIVERRENGPTVLVMEDVDHMLAPQAADNIEGIATLLNMTDGLVGRALDIRVLATTNVAKFEIDRALLRPGRLCRKVEVPMLNAAQATAVARRLERQMPVGDMTLAEVYALARAA